MITRRKFVQGVATGAGAAGLGGIDLFAEKTKLPKPRKSGIEHVVLVMMENRSFDHFLGWLPGANGRQAGLTYRDAAGIAHATHPLAPDYQGCLHADPDHTYEGGRVAYDNGACDGWMRAGQNDDYAIGYYTQADLAFLGQAAPYWTTCSAYFAAIMSETFPNRIYQHAAQTDRLTNSAALCTLPTIWDRLAENGLEGRYYFSDVPFLALWGFKYAPISRRFTTFLSDCAAGTLPQVSFVDSRFIDEAAGTSSDDHPHGDIRNGEAFLSQVYNAVATSPNWKNTVLVINFDEWGGFFEHVPPSLASIPPADQAVGNDGRRGFRVPCVVVSPFARRAYIPATEFDHTSVLKLIEWRWDLEPLTVRDAEANNLADVLDFKAKGQRAPLFAIPPGPFGGACPNTTIGSEIGNEIGAWLDLRDLARLFGWGI
jgi:phospholipase C